MIYHTHISFVYSVINMIFSLILYDLEMKEIIFQQIFEGNRKKIREIGKIFKR